MSEKGEDAFRTISEVAEELDLPQHVLRFWESRFAQIRPLKRGGGRRYYRPDDVELLRGIRYLLYVKGYTIKGVQRVLKENGSRFVIAIGSGDLAGLDALAAGSRDDEAIGGDDEAHVDDLDLIHPEPEVIASVAREEEIEEAAQPARQRPRALTGFLRRSEREPGDGPRLPRESVEMLDAVLLDLLECKRLLDQVR
ncbi:MerR family transcriptional regulator [Jiella sp. MQZ9-1]|uniref:MerR family transcriptional regulator n=1 Tax=Jiella flava TaxID=2816857 RepID=A0A939JTP0_9HYPH|nr:MerR family transcriptional regulator [Jiella flava]MBO0664203.1 MerR family transcriptional regulator [Jiella flava]MCD2472849.1 MerR family transcriptional regulator [Jiella flava]